MPKSFNGFQQTLLKQDDTQFVLIIHIVYVCGQQQSSMTQRLRVSQEQVIVGFYLSCDVSALSSESKPECYHQIPACPFGKQTARRSQVEPRGTGQLTRTERRTQTLKKDKNRRKGLARVCLFNVKISAKCGCCCSSLLSNTINMLLMP